LKTALTKLIFIHTERFGLSLCVTIHLLVGCIVCCANQHVSWTSRLLL